MIKIKTLLENQKTKKSPVNLMYLPASKGAVSHKTATNLRTFAASRGEKFIGVPNEDVKSTLKGIIPHHDHKIIVAPTIFHAADHIKNKGFSGVIVHSEPSKAKEIESALQKTHGDSMSVSVKHLPHNNTEAKSIQDIDPSIKRSDARKLLKKESVESLVPDLFIVGDYVKAGLIEGEIVSIHPKYATIVSEGEEHRVWVKDLEFSDKQPKRNQLFKESFIYKGYKTKNFNRQLSEQFKNIASNEEDTYAMLECLKVFDYVLGVTDQTISEDFNTVRIQTERLKRYSKKVGASYVTESIISLVEEELLKYSILEGAKFTTTDRNMVARVVAMVADSPINMDPSTTINSAIIKLRTLSLTPDGWKVVGRLMNVVTKSGIKWNQDSFPNSILQLMK